MVEYLTTEGRVTDRFTESGNANKIKAEMFSSYIIRPIFFTTLYLVDSNGNADTVYANHSIMDISRNGVTYLGAGLLGGIESIEEGSEFQLYGTRLTFGGILPEMVSRVLSTGYRDRPVVIECVLYNLTLMKELCAVELFSGYIDSVEMVQGKNSAISIQVENALLDWERPTNYRYTYESQKRLYPDDEGLKYLVEMLDKEILWGWSAP